MSWIRFYTYRYMYHTPIAVGALEAFSVLKWRTSALRCAPLTSPVAAASASRVRFWSDHRRNGIDNKGQPLYPRVDDFEMQLPQDLDDLKQHALSIQGVCKHRDDQVCMVGRLRVHGCVHLIHMIARCNRHAWFK